MSFSRMVGSRIKRVLAWVAALSLLVLAAFGVAYVSVVVL